MGAKAMKLQVLTAIVALGTATSVWAIEDDNAKKDTPRHTRVSVDALANKPKTDVNQGVKPGVRVLANVRKQLDDQSQADDIKPSARDRSQVRKPKSTRPDGYGTQDERQNRATGPAADHTRQFGAVSRPNSAYQWGGFVPPNQWGFMPNQWGFMPNGVNMNQVAGYRRFGFPYGFASGGFGFGYGDPYLVPSYYGFGFSPIAFGLSGPVVVHYDDPIRRQWKLVDDGVRKMAEGK
jgi:hypothetical protein